MKVGVVLVCAGRGRRLGEKEDKVFIRLGEKPMFYYSYRVFLQWKRVEQIVIVVRNRYIEKIKKYITQQKVEVIEGGRERKDSVYKGVMRLRKDIEYVVVHDGARPFIKRDKIEKIVRYLKRYEAVTLGLPLRDAIKQVDKGVVIRSLEREKTYLIQTPQGFKRQWLENAYHKWRKDNVYRSLLKKVDDETQFIEKLGGKVKVVEGDVFNIKITYPQDLALANTILRAHYRID